MTPFSVRAMLPMTPGAPNFQDHNDQLVATFCHTFSMVLGQDPLCDDQLLLSTSIVEAVIEIVSFVLFDNFVFYTF